MRLTKLTADQEAMLPAIKDEWLAVGLSCERADRAVALAGVHKAYAAAKLPPPAIVVWLESPLQGVVGAEYLKRLLERMAEGVEGQVEAQVGGQIWGRVRGQVGGQVWAQVRGQVGGQVEDKVWAQVGGQVWRQVEAQVGAQVGGQVWAQVWGQVEAQVWAQVWRQVEAQVGAQAGAEGVWDQVWGQVEAQVEGQVEDKVEGQVRAQVGDQVATAIFGQYEAGWLAFYDAFSHFGLVDLTHQLDGLIEVARNAGWWWPFRGAVLLTERPLRIHRDAQNRLHAEDGPAIVYPDGWGVWSWHGVRVTRDVIETPPEELTAERIIKEPNAEIRRVLIERIGTERYIAISGATEVARDDWGALYVGKRKDESAYAAVRVINSTPEPDGSWREFWLRVPGKGAEQPVRKCVVCEADIAVGPITAKQAIAWTFSCCSDCYMPSVMS